MSEVEEGLANTVLQMTASVLAVAETGHKALVDQLVRDGLTEEEARTQLGGLMPDHHAQGCTPGNRAGTDGAGAEATRDRAATGRAAMTVSRDLQPVTDVTASEEQDVTDVTDDEEEEREEAPPRADEFVRLLRDIGKVRRQPRQDVLQLLRGDERVTPLEIANEGQWLLKLAAELGQPQKMEVVK